MEKRDFTTFVFLFVVVFVFAPRDAVFAQTWSAQTSGTTDALMGVHFVNETTGWAVSNVATIFATTNGGSTWSAQTSGTTDTLNDVYFINDSTGWVVGDAGTILKFTGAASSNASSGGAGNSIFVRDIHARFAREYASRAYVPKNLNLRAERCTPDVCDIIIRFNAPEDAALERFMLRHGYNKQRIAFVGQREGGAFTARFEWSANAELPVELCYLNVNNSEFCSESRIWTPAAIDPNDVKIEQLRLVGDQRLITVQVPAFHNFSYLAAGRSLVLVEILDEDGKLVFLQSAIRPEKIQLRLDPRSYTLRLTPQNAAGDAGETITIPLDVFLLAEEERQTFMFRTDALWNMIFGMLADMLKGLMK